MAKRRKHGSKGGGWHPGFLEILDEHGSWLIDATKNPEVWYVDDQFTFIDPGAGAANWKVTTFANATDFKKRLDKLKIVLKQTASVTTVRDLTLGQSPKSSTAGSTRTAKKPAAKKPAAKKPAAKKPTAKKPAAKKPAAKKPAAKKKPAVK